MVSQHELAQWTQRIVEQFQPLKVILFGSYAEGTPRPDSDVDLLIVVPHQGSSFRLAAKIRMALDDLLGQVSGLDILVRSPEALEEQSAQGDQFIQKVLAQGVLLYEKNQG